MFVDCHLLRCIVQALINVVDAMLSQRTMGADTALHALDALNTASLCPVVSCRLLCLICFSYRFFTDF